MPPSTACRNDLEVLRQPNDVGAFVDSAIYDAVG